MLPVASPLTFCDPKNLREAQRFLEIRPSLMVALQ
jgi:hypothetical protein